MSSEPSDTDQRGADEAYPQPLAAPPALGQRPTEPPAEETLWSGRTHWKHYSGLLSAIAGGVIVLLIAFVAWLGWPALPWAFVLLVITLGVVGGRLATIILGTRYRLTSERLFVETGLIRQTINQTELIRVDDVRVRKLLVDRIFGLGSVDVLSTDHTDPAVVLVGVVDAERVAELIRTHMRILRRRSLFIETL